MLKKLDIEARLQLTIDQVRENKNAKENNRVPEPQTKLNIICGGLFDDNQK